MTNKEPTPWDHVRAAILKHDKDHPVDRAPKESPDDHIRRTLRYLSRTMSEAEFDAMDQSAQDWHFEQAERREKNPNAPFTFPIGYPSSDAPAAANGQAAPEAETRRARGRPSADPADGPSDNATDRTIVFAVAHADMAIDKLRDEMAKAGSGVSDIKEATRNVVAANALKVIRAAKAAGLWKDA